MGPGLLHIYGSYTNNGIDAGLYRWESRKGHSFSLGHQATVFQAEIYAIKAGIMENVEKRYTSRNICILSDSWVPKKVLNHFQINSKLGWDCHQSLVKLAERNRIQLVCVSGHMGINWK
jgi:RNase H.